MATQTIEFHAPSGQIITAKLFTPGSDTEVGSASATERTNDKGTYRASFTDTVGTFRLTALVGSVATAKGFVTTLAATGDYFPHSTLSTATAIAAVQSTLDALDDVVVNRTTIATLASQTSFTLTAGSGDDGAYNDCLAIVTDSATSVQRCIGKVANYIGASKTVALLLDPGVFTMAAGDSITLLASPCDVCVRVTASVQSTAGDDADISVWLEYAGRTVPLDGSETCSISFREISSDAEAFTVTDVDVFSGKTAVRENKFRLTKNLPGFTDDRQYAVLATVTIAGRTYRTDDIVTILGA